MAYTNWPPSSFKTYFQETSLGSRPIFSKGKDKRERPAQFIPCRGLHELTPFFFQDLFSGDLFSGDKDKDKDKITAHKATTTSDRRKQHNTRTTNTQFDPLVPPTVCSFGLASCCLYRSLAASSRSTCSRRSLVFTLSNAQGPAFSGIGKGGSEVRPAFSGIQLSQAASSFLSEAEEVE